MKDKIVSWFLRNIMLPRIEDVENPGFIVLRLAGKKSETYLRELMFSEDLLASIEKNAVSRYGDVGRQAMYSAGKKFGWEYASASNFNRKGSITTQEMESLSFNLVRYIECSFASGLTHELDLKNDLFKISMDNFVICSKDGLGYLMSSGGIAGIWGYMMNDKSVEGVEPKCQGRGDKMCEVVCAPSAVLKKNGHSVKFTESNLIDRKLTPDYLSLNKISKVSYATKSLKDMVSSGIFEYGHGIMKFKDNRYFLLEASCIYLIEKQLAALDGGEDMIFNAAFDFGSSLIKKGKQNMSFITDYMSALGWGDVYVSIKDGKYRAISSFYPWTEYVKDSKFIIFRGLVSGMISEITGKTVKLNNVQSSLASGHLDLIIS
jgi:predicted hydrocarbon binding protein